MDRQSVTIAVLAGGFLISTAMTGSDWPQWRGPHRDGVLENVQLPSELPEKLTRKWAVRVGEGHASPVLAGGRLYVFARESSQEVLYAIDAASGKVTWKQSYSAPYQVNSAAAGHGAGPKSTPVVQDGKIVTLGIGGILSAWDARDGRLLWRKDFQREFKSTSPIFGTASSPVIDRNLVIANVGGNDSGSLAAFDVNTGAVKWNWTGDGPGYASPIVVELAGIRQAVTQTQQNITGVRVDNGELLWRIPFTTDWVQNIVTPLVYKDTLILAGLNKPTMAVRIVKSGSGCKPEKLWENAEAPMYMSSPVIVGDLIFGFTNKNKGQLFCQEPRSGKVLWNGPPRQGDNAALAAGGNLLFALTANAELLAVKAQASRYEAARRYSVADSAAWAHPVITEAGVIVKDSENVISWGWR